MPGLSSVTEHVLAGPPSATAPRDHVIDFWRGVSALMVVVHHLYDRPELPLLAVTQRIGPLGVRFFFVISGYIITSLLLKEERVTKTINIKNFYIRRLFRILPALVGYMAFLALLEVLQWTHTPDIPSAIFACSIIPCSWNVAHTWSLGIEEMFYAIWPLLALLVPTYRTRLLAVLLALFTFVMSFEVLTFQGGHSDLPFSFACITIGALYAASPRFQTFTKRWGPAIACAVLVIATLVPFSHLLIRDMTPFLILVIIMSTYRLPAFVTASLPFTWIAKIGLISYSLYLYQQVFTAPAYPTPSPLQVPLLMLAFAFLSYRLIEKPAIELGKRLQSTPASEPRESVRSFPT